MATKVKIGQFWHDATGIDTCLYEIVKLDLLGGMTFAVFAKKIDGNTRLVIDQVHYLGDTDNKGENSNWPKRWVVLQETPEDMAVESSPPTLRGVAERIEKPCKNKWCGAKNDLGVRSCWKCETENPTSY